MFFNRSSYRWIVQGIPLLLAVSLLYSTTPAQGCDGIYGRTTSIQGWIIPAATIRAVDRNTKKTKIVESDGNGEYTLCLPAGSYDIFAVALGYRSQKRSPIDLDGRSKNIVDFVLKQE